jgi:hypothetical protein
MTCCERRQRRSLFDRQLDDRATGGHVATNGSVAPSIRREASRSKETNGKIARFRKTHPRQDEIGEAENRGACRCLTIQADDTAEKALDDEICGDDSSRRGRGSRSRRHQAPPVDRG